MGGFYGLQIGNIFCGESMFSKVSNASKAGFIHFAQKYRNKLDLIDCQSHTDHLESLGARMIPKREFLKILHKTMNTDREKWVLLILLSMIWGSSFILIKNPWNISVLIRWVL